MLTVFYVGEVMASRLVICAVLFNVVFPCFGIMDGNRFDYHKDLVAAVEKIDKSVGEILSDYHYNVIDAVAEFNFLSRREDVESTFNTAKTRLKEEVPGLLRKIDEMSGVSAGNKSRCKNLIVGAVKNAVNKVLDIAILRNLDVSDNEIEEIRNMYSSMGL